MAKREREREKKWENVRPLARETH